MKKVKMSDVAQKAGVSVTTVSRVINNSGYVAAEKRETVERVLAEMHYQGIPPKREAHEKLVGLVMRKLSVNMFYDTLNNALLQAAEKQGLRTVVLFSSCLDNQVLKAQVQKLLTHRVCGIVVGGFLDAQVDEDVRTFLLNCGIPIVFIERTAESYGFNRVLVDSYIGSYHAAQYLVRRGHRKLLYVMRSLNTKVESDRLRGFLRAIEEAPDSPEYIVKYCKDNSVEAGRQAMEEADQEMPGITGVMTWFDGYAAGILQYLYMHDRKVPDDVEVIGHDDTYAPLLAPPISSIRMPYEAMAEAAIQIILENQGDPKSFVPRTVLLESEFILRGTKK